MEKKEVQELRDRVPCAVVLENAGFAVDVKESTRRAVKYRRAADIVIVIHEGRGWFDPLSDAKGDVFSLAGHLEGLPFPKALSHVASLVGFVAKEPVWKRPSRVSDPAVSVAERWDKRRKPWPWSTTWRYLRDERCLPEPVIRAAIRQNVVREGPRGSVWAAHRNACGAVTGWEERGPDWRGFSAGGTKVLFMLGPADALRLCVTEAAIDAMSLAAFEHVRPDTLYLSTGGGWSPTTEATIRLLAARQDVLLLAATDNNAQGEVYAARLEAIASELARGFERLRPSEEDWNAELKARSVDECERKKGRKEKEACRMPAGRVKGEAPPAFPRPLTRPDGEAAAGEGSGRAEEDGAIHEDAPRFGPTRPKGARS